MQPFIGEIRLAAFSVMPRNWAVCNGQLLSTSANPALFSVIGAQYGGDGVTTFALPDLRGRVPIQFAAKFPQGQSSGEESHVLTTSELPQHMHSVFGVAATADQGSPSGRFFASNSGQLPYDSSGSPNLQAMAPTGPAGLSAGHENMSPFLTVQFIISLNGVFPSRV